jgi:signal transduction histidine kinase/tetratricopeptide (TPR) repeat protein
MKKILLLWILCVFLGQNELFSQGKVNVDSLTNVLNKYPKEDTLKVKILVNLINELRKSDTKKAMEYAEDAIKISQKLQDNFWLGKSNKAKASILSVSGDLEEAKVYCQKAMSFFEKKNKYPNEVANCLMMLGSIAGTDGDLLESLKHNESALAIFESTQNVEMQVKAIVSMGVAHYYLGNYEKSLELYQKGLKLNETSQDKENTRLLYTNVALIYYAMGNYALGLDYSLKTVDIAESLGDLEAVATEYNNISSVYFDLEDRKEARKYLTKALEIYRRVNDKVGIARAMINLGVTYDNDNHLKAIEELNKAKEYCKEIKYNPMLAGCYQALAYRYFMLGEYKTAYTYALQGLELGVEDAETTIMLNNNAVESLLECSNTDLLSLGIEPPNRYVKAKEHLDKVFEVAGDAQPRYMMFAYRYLAKIQEEQKNYTAAYEAYKEYIALKDSITSDEVKNQITRKGIQYEFDKKETELKFQQQLTVSELEKQKLLTFQQEQALTLNQQTLRLKEQALTLSNKDLLLANKEKDLAHLAYLKEQAEKQEKEQQLSLSQEREKGKELDLKLKNAALFSKNLELSAKQKQNLYLIGIAMLLLAGLGTLLYFYTVLRKQKNIITQQNELNEHTIAILSHDIKEPLLGVKLMLKKLNKDDPFVAQASQSLENQINAVNGILNNLLKMKKLALIKKGENVSANVNEVVQNVLQELALAIQSKELSIQIELKEKLTLPIAPEKLQIILHNLLSNAVKYSFSHQSIRIFQEGKGICIQDFGVGLSPEQRSKLMREVTASQQGTKLERGNGLGLFLVGVMLQGEQIRVVFDSPDMGGTIARIVNG